MRINSLIIFISIIIIVIGGILVANYFGLYETFRKAEPKKTLSGEYDISDIRGSHTLAEIEKYFKVPAKVVIEAFGLNENIKPDLFKIKDFKEVFKTVDIDGEEYQLETEGFRVFVSLYLKRDYKATEVVYLPTKTVSYLIKNEKLNDEQIDFWKQHQFRSQYYEDNESSTHDESDRPVITGQTTVKELLNLGITQQEFKKITGVDLPDNKSVILRDYLSEKEIPFKDVKDKFIELFEKKQK